MVCWGVEPTSADTGQDVRFWRESKSSINYLHVTCMLLECDGSCRMWREDGTWTQGLEIKLESVSQNIFVLQQSAKPIELYWPHSWKGSSRPTHYCSMWTNLLRLWVCVRPWRGVKSAMQTWWNILVQYWMGSHDLTRAQVGRLGSCEIRRYTHHGYNSQNKLSSSSLIKIYTVFTEIHLWDTRANISMMQYKT